MKCAQLPLVPWRQRDQPPNAGRGLPKTKAIERFQSAGASPEVRAAGVGDLGAKEVQHLQPREAADVL